MKNALIIFIIFSLSGCCFLTPPTKFGVLTDKENIVKSPYVKINFEAWEIDKDYFKKKIAVLGTRELNIIDKEDPSKSINIKYQMAGKPSLIRIDGKMHIVDGGGGFGDVGLMDQTGKAVWTYKQDPDSSNPNELIGGDLNSDGTPEFYASTSDDGVHVLDTNGKLVKKFGSGFIEGVDLCTYNDHTVLIDQDINDTFHFWNYEGHLIKTIKIKRYMWDFSIINWPSKNHILIKDGSSFYVLDFNGKVVFKKRAGFRILSLKGTGVNFKGGKRYLAVITETRPHYNRSILWIFSPKGDLIYKEVICSTEAITAVKDESSNKEYILVGGCNSINKYEMR